MNKYISKQEGKNAISSYKRAYNIVESAKEDLSGRPDAVLLEKTKKNICLRNLMKFENHLQLMTRIEIMKNYF